MLKQLWIEETGAILSAEIVVVSSILVIGVIVGLSAVRDAIVSELADVAQAIANINQSYSYSGILGHHAYTGGGSFHDMQDFCDGPGIEGGQNSKCVTICSSFNICGGNSDGQTYAATR